MDVAAPLNQSMKILLLALLVGTSCVSPPPPSEQPVLASASLTAASYVTAPGRPNPFVYSHDFTTPPVVSLSLWTNKVPNARTVLTSVDVTVSGEKPTSSKEALTRIELVSGSDRKRVATAFGLEGAEFFAPYPSGLLVPPGGRLEIVTQDGSFEAVAVNLTGYRTDP